jgi:hypothetical protein
LAEGWHGELAPTSSVSQGHSVLVVRALEARQNEAGIVLTWRYGTLETANDVNGQWGGFRSHRPYSRSSAQSHPRILPRQSTMRLPARRKFIPKRMARGRQSGAIRRICSNLLDPVRENPEHHKIERPLALTPGPQSTSPILPIGNAGAQLQMRRSDRPGVLLKPLKCPGQVAPGRGGERHQSEANVPATAGQIIGMND